MVPARATSPRITSGAASTSVPPRGTMTSSSRAPRARPSPERALGHRGPGRDEIRIACTAPKEQLSPAEYEQ
eukprot:10621307-Alexandrium_andersonii.AAC.1